MALDLCQYTTIGETCTTSEKYFRQSVNQRFQFLFDRMCNMLLNNELGFQIILIESDPVDLTKFNTIQINDTNHIFFVDKSGNVFEIDMSTNVVPVYETNAAALLGGLQINDTYRTSTGDLKIVI